MRRCCSTVETWSINRDPSGPVSQKDQPYALIKTEGCLLTGYHPGY